jgi:hypothetical protein
MTEFVATRAIDEGAEFRVHVHTRSGQHIGSFDLDTGILHIAEVLLATEFAKLAYDWIERFRSGELLGGGIVKVATL